MKSSSTFKQTLAIGTALGALLCAGTAHAWATVTADPPVAPPTGEVTITGTHFSPNSPVDVFLKWKQCSLNTDAQGRFACIFKVPGSVKPGPQPIWTVNRHSGKWLKTPFTVAAATTDWPQYRYSPTRQGANPNENVIHSSNVANLAVRWNFPTSGMVHNSMTVVGGIAYFGSFDGTLYAVNAKTGAQFWTVTPSPSGPGWYGTLMNTGSPAVVDGKIYIGTIDHHFYAFEAATGKQLWAVDTQDDLEATSPTVAGGVVYIGGGCPESDCFNGLRALNAATGKEIWKVKLGLGVATGATVGNGVVYVGGGDGMIYALDSTTGRTMWKTRAGTAPLSLSAALAGGVLYVGSSAGRIYALSAKDGTPDWSAPIQPGSFSAPAVKNGVVYIGAGQMLYAFDTGGGNPRWSTETGGDVIWSSPTVANDVIYIGSNGGGIGAYAASNGAPLWSALPNQTVHSAPTIAGGALYVGSEDGHVYAFALKP